MRIALAVFGVAVLVTVAVFAARELPPSPLTVEELALAQGVHWWTMRVPPGVEGSTLAVTFIDETGIATHGGAVGAFQEGDLLKVFIYDLDRERIGSAIILPSSVLRDSPRNRFHGLPGSRGFVPVGSQIEPGQVLVKMSRFEGSAMSLSGPIKPGEVGIVVDFER